jgi:hypothetical protein
MRFSLIATATSATGDPDGDAEPSIKPGGNRPKHQRNYHQNRGFHEKWADWPIRSVIGQFDEIGLFGSTVQVNWPIRSYRSYVPQFEFLSNLLTN